MLNLSYIHMEICDVRDLLAIAPRLGDEKDIPEGTRYIQISDTLARKIEKKLDECLDHIKHNQSFHP